MPLVLYEVDWPSAMPLFLEGWAKVALQELTRHAYTPPPFTENDCRTALKECVETC